MMSKVRRRLLAFTPVIGQKQLWSWVENLLRKRVPARRLFKGKNIICLNLMYSQKLMKNR